MVEIRRPRKPYEDHRKEFAAARGSETSQGEPERSEVEIPSVRKDAAGVVSKDQAAGPPRPALAAGSPRATHFDQRLRLKFTVHAPQAGLSAYFDRAVALMGEGKALRLVLARAFDQLEAAVAAGEAVEQVSYPADPTRSTNTSRHISVALHASAKAKLDPMDLLPPGSFGRELAMVALARSLARSS